MTKYQSAITSVLKHMHRPPSWLHEDENIRFDTRNADDHDAITIRAYLTGPVLARCKMATRDLPGRAVVAASYRGDGALIDMVRETYLDLMEGLEPPLPADDLLELMLQAFGNEQACDVLVDAGLEREAIRPQRRSIGTRADTRTDAEKLADERADLRKKALKWARPFVEILFRRNWSTKPWATDPLRLAGHILTTYDAYEMRFNPSGLTSGIAMDQERAIRRLADLRDAGIISNDEASRFLAEYLEGNAH